MSDENPYETVLYSNAEISHLESYTQFTHLYAVFLHDCPFCPTSAIQVGQATWVTSNSSKEI